MQRLACTARIHAYLARHSFIVSVPHGRYSPMHTCRYCPPSFGLRSCSICQVLAPTQRACVHCYLRITPCPLMYTHPLSCVPFSNLSKVAPSECSHHFSLLALLTRLAWVCLHPPPLTGLYVWTFFVNAGDIQSPAPIINY